MFITYIGLVLMTRYTIAEYGVTYPSGVEYTQALEPFVVCKYRVTICTYTLVIANCIPKGVIEIVTHCSVTIGLAPM